MPAREQLELIKRATVAIALVPDKPPEDRRKTPFLIVGSGFCVDPDGIVITCEHVLRAFSPGIREAIAAEPKGDQAPGIRPLRGLRMLVPHALFFVPGPTDEQLSVLQVRVAHAVAKLEYDLGAIRVWPHAGFSSGFPALGVEPFGNVYEGMELATCGFPLGNALQEQLGTMTSSFTRGILSSIAPAANAREELVTGYQLDITATFGNSGGPVFSWSTGRVLGVLQGGPKRDSGEPVPGLARAEPIYRILRDSTLVRLKAQPLGHPPEGLTA